MIWWCCIHLKWRKCQRAANVSVQQLHMHGTFPVSHGGARCGQPVLVTNAEKKRKLQKQSVRPGYDKNNQLLLERNEKGELAFKHRVRVERLKAELRHKHTPLEPTTFSKANGSKRTNRKICTTTCTRNKLDEKENQKKLLHSCFNAFQRNPNVYCQSKSKCVSSEQIETRTI